MNYYEDIYNALVHKAQNPVPPSDGILTMRIVIVAFRRGNERKVVPLERLSGFMNYCFAIDPMMSWKLDLGKF